MWARNLVSTGIFIVVATLATGCYTARTTVALNPAKVRAGSTKRTETIAVKFQDVRTDTTSVGKMSGRIGKNAIFEVNGKLEDRIADLFGDVLADAGYRVVSDAPALLEGEVREFWVRADGWTQGASERIRVRVRGKAGTVLWEHTLRGEDGGMDMVDSFAEKSMNVALTRLLTEAAEEFTSEAFHQAVEKANSSGSTAAR